MAPSTWHNSTTNIRCTTQHGHHLNHFLKFSTSITFYWNYLYLVNPIMKVCLVTTKSPFFQKNKFSVFKDKGVGDLLSLGKLWIFLLPLLSLLGICIQISTSIYTVECRLLTFYCKWWTLYRYCWFANRILKAQEQKVRRRIESK